MSTDQRTRAELPFDPQMMDIVCRRVPTGQVDERGNPVTRLAVNIDQKIVHHSPTGFEIGYGGSGPADFALNVMALFLPLAGEEECYSCLGYGHFRDDGHPSSDGRDKKCLDCRGSGKVPAQGVQCFDGRCSEAAWAFHHAFKFKFIAKLPPEGGTILGADIRAWIQERLPEAQPHA